MAISIKSQQTVSFKNTTNFKILLDLIEYFFSNNALTNFKIRAHNTTIRIIPIPIILLFIQYNNGLSRAK